MSAWSEAFAEVVLSVQPDLDPVLTKGGGSTPDLTKELDQIIDNNLRGALWTTITPVLYGATISPTARMGSLFVAREGGTTGVLEPSWPVGQGARVVDGTVTWEETSADYASIYNIRRAIYEAWRLKATKAASRNQYINDGRAQGDTYLYLNCVREAARFKPVRIA